MIYSHFIFDLDGTLVDSAAEIHDASCAICSMHRLSMPSIEYIRSMTGAPPGIFFRDHGCKDEDVDRLVFEFREYLAVNAGDPKCVIDGVNQLLDTLKTKDIRISLATTKPSSLASILLDRYQLSGYFSHIQGTEHPLRHKPEPDIINKCLDKAPSLSSVMVGDTTFDIQAAQNASIDSIAVCSGSHAKSILQDASPTLLVDSPRELLAYLQQL